MTAELATIETGETLGYEIRIEAPPELVWSYFVDPERLVRWMGETAMLDPRPGGEFRLRYGQGDVVSGAFVVLEPPTRLVFTWGWEMPGDPVPPGASRVEVDLKSEDGGEATLLRLRHLGLPVESRSGHAEGWRYFLPQLPTAIDSATDPATGG